MSMTEVTFKPTSSSSPVLAGFQTADYHLNNDQCSNFRQSMAKIAASCPLNAKEKRISTVGMPKIVVDARPPSTDDVS